MSRKKFGWLIASVVAVVVVARGLDEDPAACHKSRCGVLCRGSGRRRKCYPAIECSASAACSRPTGCLRDVIRVDAAQPRRVIVWKVNNAGGSVVCSSLASFATSTGTPYVDRSFGGGALLRQTVAMCLHVPPLPRLKWWYRRRVDVLQFFVARRPIHAAVSSYYSNYASNCDALARWSYVRGNATRAECLAAKNHFKWRGPSDERALEFLAAYFDSNSTSWSDQSSSSSSGRRAIAALEYVASHPTGFKVLLYERLVESLALVQLHLRFGGLSPPPRVFDADESKEKFEKLWPNEAKKYVANSPGALDAARIYALAERRFEAQVAKVGVALVANVSKCVAAHARLHANQTQMVLESELVAALRDRIWLVSHGGVGSEYFRGLLATDDALRIPKALVGARRPLRAVAAHYPYPPRAGPKLVIYLYGSARLAVISQVGRHPDNAAKLHNLEAYPRVNSFDDLFAIPGDDPFGIEAQFFNFANGLATYPIVYVRSDAIEPWVVRLVSRLVGTVTPRETRLNDYRRLNRTSSLATVSEHARARVDALYGDLDRVFDAQPPLALFWPPPPPPLDKRRRRNSRRACVLRRTILTDSIPEKMRRVVVDDKRRACWPDDDDDEEENIVDDKNRRWRFKHVATIGEFTIFNMRRMPGNVALLAAISNKNDATTTTGYVLPEKTERGCPHEEGRTKYGYEDPRAFEWKGLPYVVMNGKLDACARAMYLLNVTSARVVRLWIPRSRADEPESNRWALERVCCKSRKLHHHRCVEKNWIPFVDRGKLRFVYAFSETTIGAVLELVDSDGRCDVVHGTPRLLPSSVAGGSSLLQWVYPFFVAFAHTRNATELNREGYVYAYRAVPLLLDVRRFRIWLGKPLDFPAPNHHLASPWRDMRKDVQYPYHIAFDDRGESVVVGVDYQDRLSVAFKFDLLEFAKLIPSRGGSPHPDPGAEEAPPPGGGPSDDDDDGSLKHNATIVVDCRIPPPPPKLH